MLRAIDSNSDGKCESFGSYWSFTLDVSDRSAASAWPWVVGDFLLPMASVAWIW